MAFFLRKSPTNFDYSRRGAYFLTVCIQGRGCLLGKILNGSMQLNDAGRMVEKWWLKIESNFPLIKTDTYIVMPNHFHGIVFSAWGEPDSRDGTGSGGTGDSGERAEGAHMGAPLHKIVQWFKTMSTNEYVHGVKEHGWKPFKNHLWQRSFYDHVIRKDESLNRIREYIINNPLHWDLDRENPRAKGEDDFDLWLASYKTNPSRICRGAPMCAPSANRQLGDAGEDLAAAALKKAGYKILARNYLTPLGEIDLIARHGKIYVFVEVKTRRSARFGAPQEAVSPVKQAKLRRLADYYLKQKRLGEAPVRFDVVGITLGADGPQVEIIQDAF